MPSSDVITLSPRLKLYKRDDRGGVYHLRARLKGRNGYVFRSTDEGDAKKATELAWEIFYKLQSQQDQGVIIGGTRFDAVYKLFERDVLPHKSPPRRIQYEGAFRRYFLKFFGSTEISSLNEVKLRTYFEFRINYHTTAEALETVEKAKTRRRGPKPRVQTHKNIGMVSAL